MIAVPAFFDVREERIVLQIIVIGIRPNLRFESAFCGWRKINNKSKRDIHVCRWSLRLFVRKTSWEEKPI